MPFTARASGNDSSCIYCSINRPIMYNGVLYRVPVNAEVGSDRAHTREIQCVSKNRTATIIIKLTPPIHTIHYLFLAQIDRIQFSIDYTIKKFLNWPRIICVVSITIVAT